MKTAKRTLAVLLACLMVFGSFGMVGSAKFNTSTTIDPVNPGDSGNGTITYGLDIYKVGDEGLTKLADGDTLSPGDVIEVQVAFGTDFYMGALTGQIYYDSDYLQPALNGKAYTVTDSGNIWEEDNQSNPPFMKQLTEDLPKATTNDGLYTVDLFGALTPIELGGLKGIVNKDDQDAVVRRYTPLAWRIAEKNGQPQTKITAACDVDPEMLHYHFVQFQLASNNQNLIDKHNIIVPYATYASFQLLVKDGADSAGELEHAIFIPIDAAKRETAQTCNQLYGTNTNRNNGIFSAQASVAYLNGQGIDVTNADYDFKFGEAEPPHEHTYGEPTWTWNDEYTEATATFTCTDNDDTQEVKTTNINTTVISELGCVTDYVVTYSATVSFGDQNYTDTTDPFTVDYATGHTWSDSIEKIDEQYHGHKCTVCEAVDEETKEEHVYNIEGGIIRDATLDQPGLKLMECICGAQTEVEFTLDHDHTYGEPVWSWNDDYTEATATFTCVDNDDTQILTTTDISCEELEEAKCGVDQVVQYLASVEFGDETYETTSDPVTVPGTALEHTYGDPEWKWSDDCTLAYATFTANEDPTHTVTVPATNVTNEVTKDATCTEAGETTYTATVLFNDETYTDTKTLDRPEALGHDWEEPVWHVAEDGTLTKVT
ncbi:MAG: hypothetical protein IKW76_10565, partial [Clostridia bacterium]|nr:hypothetical protein [Clostridia bacterium]